MYYLGRKIKALIKMDFYGMSVNWREFGFWGYLLVMELNCPLTSAQNRLKKTKNPNESLVMLLSKEETLGERKTFEYYKP